MKSPTEKHLAYVSEAFTSFLMQWIALRSLCLGLEEYRANVINLTCFYPRLHLVSEPPELRQVPSLKHCIAKGTTAPRVEFIYNCSYTNLDQISSPESRPSVNQTSASRLNLNFNILTKPGFRILTNIQLQNLNQTSAAKY